MKFESISEDKFRVFYPFFDKKELDYENKEELKKLLLEVLTKIKKLYSISITGFYEVKVNVLGILGLDLEFSKLDSDIFSSKVIDLKIIIYLNPLFYLCFDNYDVISSYELVYFYNDKFFVPGSLVKEEDFYNLSEWYSIFYDNNNEIIYSKLLYS